MTLCMLITAFWNEYNVFFLLGLLQIMQWKSWCISLSGWISLYRYCLQWLFKVMSMTSQAHISYWTNWVMACFNITIVYEFNLVELVSHLIFVLDSCLGSWTRLISYCTIHITKTIIINNFAGLFGHGIFAMSVIGAEMMMEAMVISQVLFLA